MMAPRAELVQEAEEDLLGATAFHSPLVGFSSPSDSCTAMPARQTGAR